jgi:hypothetical protein
LEVAKAAVNAAKLKEPVVKITQTAQGTMIYPATYLLPMPSEIFASQKAPKVRLPTCPSTGSLTITLASPITVRAAPAAAPASARAVTKTFSGAVALPPAAAGTEILLLFFSSHPIEAIFPLGAKGIAFLLRSIVHRSPEFAEFFCGHRLVIGRQSDGWQEKQKKS